MLQNIFSHLKRKKTRIIFRGITEGKNWDKQSRGKSDSLNYKRHRKFAICQKLIIFNCVTAQAETSPVIITESKLIKTGV